jgi:hypothetical protein
MSSPTSLLIQPAVNIAKNSVSTTLQHVGVDPCALTASAGLAGAVDLSALGAQLQASVNASLAQAEQTILNALNIPALQSALNSINGLIAVLKTPIPMGLTISTPSLSLFQIVNTIIGNAITNIINQIEQQALNQAEKLAAQAINQAAASVANLVASDLRKDLGPVLKVINTLNGIVGQVEAQKAFVQSILNTASTCPAKAAVMAEAYFKLGAKKL